MVAQHAAQQLVHLSVGRGIHQRSDCDNRPSTPNPGQADTDADNVGNACDEDDADSDNDGTDDAQDNCNGLANADQADTDGDGVGDACHVAADADGDFWADSLDYCPDTFDSDNFDTDNDGVGDACNDAEDTDGDEWRDALDNCPDVPNVSQADTDGVDEGDACNDHDDDGDEFGSAKDCDNNDPNSLTRFEDFDCDDGPNTLGDGSEWSARVIKSTPANPEDVVAADVDGDGDLDVLVAYGSTDRIGWHENKGGAGGNLSWDFHYIGSTIDNPYTIAAADVDGDGDVDVVTASSSHVLWFENQGDELGAGAAGAFTNHVINSESGVRAVSIADVDGDGDLDILSGSTSSNGTDLKWHENDGTSTWTEHAVGLTGGTHTIHAVDLDADGDLDVVSANYTTSNTTALYWFENDGAEQGVGSAGDLRGTPLAREVPL